MKLDSNEVEKIIKNKIDYYCRVYGEQFKIALIEIMSLEKATYEALEAKQEEKLIPLSKWNEHYEHPSVGSLRQSYFHRHENGFDYCVEYGGDNGGRILINVDKYNEWRKSRHKTA